MKCTRIIYNNRILLFNKTWDSKCVCVYFNIITGNTTTIQRYINKKQRKFYYQKQSILAKKIIEQLKINGCAICGYNKCNYCLHFHHVISKAWEFRFTADELINHSSEQIINELDKCILLCSNCHGEIHAKEREEALIKNQNYILIKGDDTKC